MGVFLVVRGRCRWAIFPKALVLLFGCVCIQLAIVSLWHLEITHSLGSLTWPAQRNQGIEVAHHFWLSRCRSKLLLTYTKVVENMCNSAWNLFFSRCLAEGIQTILKNDMLTFFVTLAGFSLNLLLYVVHSQIRNWDESFCQAHLLPGTDYASYQIQWGVNLDFAIQDYECFLLDFFLLSWLVFLLFLHLVFWFEFQHQNDLRSQNMNREKQERTWIWHWILTCMWFSGISHLTFT